MPETRDFLEAPAGYRSREVALFVAQMDDQSRRLAEDTRSLTPAELEWQPALGMNTVGMLLAHIAIVEVFWVQVGLERPFDCTSLLGIGEWDDGLPLAAEGRPPETLRGKELDTFDDLLARARAHTKHSVADLTDADLDREVTRRKRDGTNESFNLRWVFYHMLEHLAGHYGQVLLLRHQYRVTQKA